MNKYQIAKKEKGICINCDSPAVPRRSRCQQCLDFVAAKQRIKYQTQKNDPEYVKRRREYMRIWREKNPEKVAVYKTRQTEYNKRYNWKGLQ